MVANDELSKIDSGTPYSFNKISCCLPNKKPVKYRCKKAVFDETEVLDLLPEEITSHAQEYKENG